MPGFNGRLAVLLSVARTKALDLGRLPLTEVLAQLADAVREMAPLASKGEWVVMAAVLLLLRSRLLLPEHASPRRAAEAAASRLRGGLLRLAQLQALAHRLERRPRLGRDVFARGGSAAIGASAREEVDVIEFLWASLALFETRAGRGPLPSYRPVRFDLHPVEQAVERVRRLLATSPQEQTMDRLLPAPAEAETPLQRRSAWTSTFAASLELARCGDVAIEQEHAFAKLRLSAVSRI